MQRNPNAYILRPPYLYGPMNNVYREAFVFDCAMNDRPFYLPRDGEMPLQFFYIDDLCRFMDVLLDKHPEETVYNVGNPDTVSVKEWVSLCYQAAGKEPSFVNVHNDGNVRDYFCFYDYAYALDVQRQTNLMPHTTPLAEGLCVAYERYIAHPEEVNKKPLMAFIDENLIKGVPRSMICKATINDAVIVATIFSSSGVMSAYAIATDCAQLYPSLKKALARRARSSAQNFTLSILEVIFGKDSVKNGNLKTKFIGCDLSTLPAKMRFESSFITSR